MPTVDINSFEDSFVIHFGGELERINVYTLAGTLVNLADAAKAANASINPGYEIEVVVESLGPGSFRGTVRTLYRGAQNLFTRENLRMIVLAVIANFVYQHTLAPDMRVNVDVGSDEVVIQQGDTRIIVPRDVHEATNQVERSPRFRQGIGDAFRTIGADASVVSVGFSPSPTDRAPLLTIPRDRFATLPSDLEIADSDTRELTEITDLRIVRAILERSRRRWQFVWHGVKISAPVSDDTFYTDFFAHKITIAPGDALRVRLRLVQKRDRDLVVWINDSYEVVEVLDHLPRSEQSSLEFGQ